MAAPGLVATGLWLAATVGSTAVVWTATSIVAADVSDRPAAAIARKEVVSQLESGPPEVQPATTVTRPSPGDPASTAARPVEPPVTPPPQPPIPPATTAAPLPASPGTSAAAPATTTTQPPAQPAVQETATYSTPGGVARVACEGFFFIRLISATPANGYSTIVVSRGPANVEVHFVRLGQDHSVRAVCFGQPVRYYDDDSTFRSGRAP